MVRFDEILTLLTGDTTLEEKIAILMNASLESGGTDNITIILARVQGRFEASSKSTI